MVLDEKFWDEKWQFHPNLDESVSNLILHLARVVFYFLQTSHLGSFG